LLPTLDPKLRLVFVGPGRCLLPGRFRWLRSLRHELVC